MATPVDTIYSQRSEFIIVALTGITGSGCSAFAQTMSMPFEGWVDGGLVRGVKLEGVKADDPKEQRKHEIFRREYALCYNFCQKNYDEKGQFEVVKYRNVLLYCMLEWLTGNYDNPEEVRENVSKLLKQKFDKSHEPNPKENTDIDYPEVNNDFTTKQLCEMGLNDDLIKDFWEVGDEESRREQIYELFFSNAFGRFCEAFYDELKRRDYYAKNFFVHRLAFSFRAAGQPFEEYDKKKEYGHEHLFYVVEKINDIIKGCHKHDKNKARRFVIDSIRNSMELLFLRERYNSFYSIALHNDGRERFLVTAKVAEAIASKPLEDLESEERQEIENKAKPIVDKMMDLSEVEGKKDDFEEGKFFSPDISRCVTESELHIRFYEEDSATTFKTYTEQWMKYISLILRPGIVAPTRDERCMSIAYVAKFNSGCISRQVGCVIIDEEKAVQSVGWNDPPAPQLPCNLRDIDSLFVAKGKYDNSTNKNDKTLYQIYSKFELADTKEYPQHDDKGDRIGTYGKGFCDCLNHDCSDVTVNNLKDNGLQYAYCFRSRYNTYKENKDAVNTRSLHAEENTMLRLARQGGMGLNGGTMYVTASPCVLCSKKAYQIGIRDIVYLDPYTDIAPDLILNCGYDSPRLRAFRGAIGGTFYKLYQPFIPYKDELKIWEEMTKGGEV